jgi:hypothetical protein
MAEIIGITDESAPNNVGFSLSITAAYLSQITPFTLMISLGTLK